MLLFYFKLPPTPPSSLGPIMSELGADWDDDELAEAEAAMDPAGKGVVPFETFKAWWLN